MSMFAGTVGYYRRWRPGIPEPVAAVLDQAAPAPRTDLILLACAGRSGRRVAGSSPRSWVAASRGSDAKRSRPVTGHGPAAAYSGGIFRLSAVVVRVC